MSVVNVVNNVASVIYDVEEFKEVPFILHIYEIYQAQQLEDNRYTQANSIESSNYLWLVIHLHLSYEAKNESKHVNRKHTREIQLCTHVLCIDDFLNSTMLFDVVSKFSIDFWHDFLNCQWTVILNRLLCPDVSKFLEQVQWMKINDVMFNGDC